MIEIRMQDKLFLALALPAALCAAYVWGWRNTAAKELSDWEMQSARLVTPEDFPRARAAAQAACAAAEKGLEAERRVPEPRTCVRGSAKEDVATRDRTVLTSLRAAGTVVLRRTTVETEGLPQAAAALAASGVRPQPVARTYALEGNYPAVMDALSGFARREEAVIPGRVTLDGGAKVPVWNVTLGL